MALEISLREICSSLTSVRATERKKSAETLKDMLSRTAIPSLLNENMRKKSGYNWNHVFNDINDYVLKETEKFESNKNFSVIVGISTSLLNLCVSISIKGGAHIKCETIMEACLYVFNDNRLRKAIGDMYFSVLYKHVISNEYYIGYITPSVWENLLDACLTTCLSNSSELDSLTKFKLLWLVIKNANNTTQFYGCLKNSLTDIRKSVEKVINDKKVHEFAMKIILLLMELLSTECRLLICEFSESVLPIVFKFYDLSMEIMRKSLLFKVLQTAIALHHPLGKLQNEEGSSAHDWDTWYKHMHSILEIVCIEVNHMQKSLKQSNNFSSINCEIFYNLAAITYYQIFNENSSDETEGSVESLAKRPKINFNKYKTFHDLLEELQQNHEPWVGIINMYVKHFKKSLTEKDYLMLIKIFEFLISNTNKSINWDNLSKLCCSVVDFFIQSRGQITNDKEDVFITLWNTCVRNSSVINAAHKSIHTIMQSLLKLEILKYLHVQPLMLLYFEKGMPVNNNTLNTLNLVYYKFYSKCCYVQQKIKCLNWLTHLNITDVDVETIKILLLRLISNENILPTDTGTETTSDNIYEILFNNIETSILFGNFDYEIKFDKNLNKDAVEEFDVIETNKEMNTLVMEYLQNRFCDLSSITDMNILIEKGKYVHVVLHLYEVLHKHKMIAKEEIISSPLYFVVVNAIKNLFVLLLRCLKSEEQIKNKISLLKCLQRILQDDYGDFLNGIIRTCIDENCFYAVNAVLKTGVEHDEDDNNFEDDIELSLVGLRHQCVYFLASYCTQQHTYTDEIIKCVLDGDLYKLESHWDVECAFRCINMVIDHDKSNKHIDVVFGLMKDMCKVLYRNSKASLGLLKILLKILNRIWATSDNVLRKNCIIMVKGYFERCNKLYYPPNVAVLIYECAIRVVKLNKKYGIELDEFTDLTNQLKGIIHVNRIYCCYLMKHLYVDITEDDIKEITKLLRDIFLIEVPTGMEVMLKDEMINRTLTVLHCFFALSAIKPTLLHNIFFEIIRIQNKKSMSKHLTTKVLKILIKFIAQRTLEDYVNSNIKVTLYHWFLENEKFSDLPVNLLGYKSVDVFLEKNIKWLVAFEILWGCKGLVEKSEVIKLVVPKSGKTTDDIIEMCFCQIITSCLPYIVIEKYNLEDEKQSNFKQLFEHSNKMFQSVREILKNEKWSNLFVQHMGDLILLAATHMCDPLGAKQDFQLLQLHTNRNTFLFSKKVFKAVLKYFGALIDGNIMQYLCENQPLIILNILFKLWGNYVNENVLELKILHLHTFVSFIEDIPLGFQSDAVLLNFAFNTLSNAISESKIPDELKVLVQALKLILEEVSKEPSEVLKSLQRTVLTKVISILSTKKESNICGLTKSLMDFKNSIDGDVVDFIDSVYRNQIVNHKCCSKSQFEQMLETYISSLIYPSEDVLHNLREFLKTNSQYITMICKDLNIKGFSEECLKSQVHCIINALCTILKSSNDEKIIIDACNCLAELATYDIKTLVTVRPTDTEKVRTLSPKQYFAYIVLLTLSNELFDENPSVNSKVAKVINRILKYRDGKFALDMDGINKDILLSLSPVNCDVVAQYEIDDGKLDSYKAADFWIPKENENHFTWVERITFTLLKLMAGDSNCADILSSICAMKPSACAKIMPSIVGLLIDSDSRANSEMIIQIFGVQINEFFSYIWEMTFDYKLESSEDGTSTKISSKLDNNHKMIIQYMLDLINFVRLQAKNYKIRKLLCLNYLNLDYNKVAWAAALADLNLVAIYYGELWAAAQQDGVPPASPDATSNLDGGGNLQRIFRGCFVSIGELDAVDGCGTAHLTSEEEKRKHLINTGQYMDSLLLHDIALSQGTQDRKLQYGAVISLHRAGMHHLALQYIKSCPHLEELNDIKYDCLSFLGDWGDFVDTRELEQKSKMSTYNINSVARMYRYACLKDCLNMEPNEDFYVKLTKPFSGAKLAIARMCRDLNMENSQCVYKIMANLHLFRDIENYFDIRFGKAHISTMIDSWKIDKLPPYRDFKHLEAIISQRNLILQHAAENYGLYSAEINSLQLQYAELGLSNRRIQMAQRVVAMVKGFHSSKEVTLLESKVSWDKGHKDIALSLLHDNVVDESDNAKLTAMSLRQYGLWMAECKRENARDIINQYLEKSLNVLKDGDDVGTRLKVYYDIAKFADAEYKQVVAYMNSSIFENKVKCMESMKGTAACLKSSQQKLTRDEKKALIANNAFRELDEAEIANTRAEKECFLNLAMRYYLLSLQQSEENNLSVFRVIALWFENSNIDLNDGLGEVLQAIPSWKFITVLPQIAPRLSAENTPFDQHLKNIIVRCAKEHPHHTLPILFNLKNSDKDNQFGKGTLGSTSSRECKTSVEPRVAAATALISRLANENPITATLISQMAQICEAIIGFAYFVPTSREIGKPLPIPQGERIASLRDMDSIPVPTDTIAIKKDCDYSNLSSLSGFDNSYELVGGINYPKKISCRSSDGKKRILLIKGEDDLRQDAVMQQVFTIVNTLLEKNSVTYHNKLLIRTYKVVPMSRRSGVLEWCAGTMPLGMYLMHAHTRYRPQDISPSIARNKLKECHENRRSNKHKLAVFNEILRVFKPVFHYFFTENYLDPVTWYERRLAYTRSVATSSMVGYIMGLGDRHVQNILIDKTTAEVIHIDFGIAFDQGKTLPTPETVPFRLTQDIVAGFGCSGVEGIFRRGCEKTLQLLRDNQETLLTILEVLLCDPLYLWIVPSAVKNTNERRGENAAGGGLAERALLAVRSKVSGAEGGAGGVSVRGQVAALLHRATDRANLCRLFHGWQPYL